jgi:hypothetical protein
MCISGSRSISIKSLIGRTRSDVVPMFVNDCVNYVSSNLVAFVWWLSIHLHCSTLVY